VVQYALPDSDVSTTNWSQGAGDGDGSAFDELDEGFGAGRGSGSGPDDATTYWLTTVAGATIECNLTSVTDPNSSTGHWSRMRTRKSAAAGQQQDHTISLVQGTTLISLLTLEDVSEVWTTREDNEITAVDADSITDYTDLRIRVTVDEIGGGAGRQGQCSAHEFECPDAGPTVTQPYYVRTGGVPGMRIGRPGSVFGRSW